MKITKMLYIGWQSSAHTQVGGYYRITEYDVTTIDNDYKLLKTEEIDFDVPEIDGRGELVESLKRKKDAIITKATQEAVAIEEKIQQLLALDSPSFSKG